MSHFMKHRYIVSFIVICLEISFILSLDECSLDKRNFAECLLQQDESNAVQDDTKLKLIRNKIDHCFTDNQCQPPNYEKTIQPPVNVTGGLKQHWNGLPENVQDCIRLELRDKTVFRLAKCIAEDDLHIQRHQLLNQTSKGFKTFYHTRNKVYIALQQCKDEKGDAIYLKASTCAYRVMQYVQSEICARFSTCQFEKVGTLCLQANHDIQFTICKCRQDHLKNIIKAVDDLLARSNDVTLDDLSNALGNDEGTEVKKESKLQGCFAQGGIAAPDVSHTLPPAQGTFNPLVTSGPVLEAGTKATLAGIFQSNIIVNKQQITNVRLMLQARMDEEICKCE